MGPDSDRRSVWRMIPCRLQTRVPHPLPETQLENAPVPAQRSTTLYRPSVGCGGSLEKCFTISWNVPEKIFRQ